MANPGKQNAGGKRHKRGFSQAGALVRKQIRNVSEGRGIAETRLLTHWPEIVGPDIAALSRPLRVAYGRRALGATLTLFVRGAAAPQIQAQLPRIRELVNACYGYNAISKIALTQTAPTGFGDTSSPFDTTPGEKPRPAAPAKAVENARAATKEISDPALRDALSGLGQNILTRNNN